MKLIDKIKNALFEDEEDDSKSVPMEQVKEVPIAKKIDIEKTFENKVKLEEEKPVKREEKPKSPIIFDDEDFLMDVKQTPVKEVKKEIKKEEKILYGGYDNKEYGKNKEKFKPSPLISPVYGLIKKEAIKEDRKSFKDTKLTYEKLFSEEKKEINFDEVREKAYGKKGSDDKENTSDLFFDMQNEDKVAIDKITLGDAEEYFNDLGLEYNVDYEDKEKKRATTRTSKNKELAQEVDEEIKENKKIKKELENKEELNQSEEKNLYDLIDMMYDNKE